MRSVLFVIIIVLALCQCGHAENADWLWDFQVEGYATVGKLGELLSATEGYDNAPLDVQMPKNPKVKLGVYQPSWPVQEPGNSEKYFSSDVRGRIAPGQAKRWQEFRVWRMPSSGTQTLKLVWFPDPTYAPTATISGKPANYRLTVTGSQTVAGAPAVGAVFQLTPGQSGSVLLPNAGTGTNAGYVFDFTVEVVPEPSGLLILSLGLAAAPLRALARRRR